MITRLKIVGLLAAIVGAIVLARFTFHQKAPQNVAFNGEEVQEDRMVGGPSWYGSAGWGYRTAITLDYTKIATTTAVTNFPLMYSTTTLAALKYTGSGGHVGKSDGTDILITAADGTTKLNHQIETYNSSTGETILWFNSGATALSTSTNTTYYMYYGNSGASDQQNSTAVWDSNYKGVWHLKEDPAGTFPPLKDSTSNTKDLGVQGSGGTQSSVTGKIGNAFNNNRNSQYSTLIASSTSPTGMGTGDQSIEGWIYLNSIFSPTDANQVQLFGRAQGTYPYSYFSLMVRDNGKFFAFANLDGTPSADASSTLSTGQWYHLALTSSGTSQKIYLNGSVDLSYTNSASIVDNIPFVIGSAATGYNYYGADAKYDELRMSNTVRSDSWIKTEYNNQNAPNTFWSAAAEETEPVAPSAGERRVIHID